MKDRQSGQVLLMVMLATAVILTLVLSVVSRSITDISVTTGEEEALRAFSAAEAGIEEALVQEVALGEVGTGSVGVEATDLEADYSYLVEGFPDPATATEYLYPFELGSGESGTVWLVPHNPDGSLDQSTGFDGNRLELCWGPASADGGIIPAVEISLVYQDNIDSQIKIARRGFDPHNSRHNQNNFVHVTGSGCNNVGDAEEDFAYSTGNINVTTGTNRLIPGTVNPGPGQFKFARVRMLYNTDTPHSFALINTSTGQQDSFPSQGKLIESTGSSGVSTRKVQVYSLYPEAPSVFDSALFSPNDILK